MAWADNLSSEVHNINYIPGGVVLITIPCELGRKLNLHCAMPKYAC